MTAKNGKNGAGTGTVDAGQIAAIVAGVLSAMNGQKNAPAQGKARVVQGTLEDKEEKWRTVKTGSPIPTFYTGEETADVFIPEVARFRGRNYVSLSRGKLQKGGKVKVLYRVKHASVPVDGFISAMQELGLLPSGRKR